MEGATGLKLLLLFYKTIPNFKCYKLNLHNQSFNTYSPRSYSKQKQVFSENKHMMMLNKCKILHEDKVITDFRINWGEWNQLNHQIQTLAQNLFS